ncbi:MAG: hypothetical protein QM802_17415 [Agriterribacter sp.]
MSNLLIAILTLLIAFKPGLSFAQKNFQGTFIDGKLYPDWMPSSTESAFAVKQIKAKLHSSENFEIKKMIRRLCYIDTIWGNVSTYLMRNKIIDTTNPYKSFLKVFYSHSKDSIFSVESYLFDPSSKMTREILSAYALKKTKLIDNLLFDSISRKKYIEEGKYIELLGSASAFYKIDNYKIYSDRYLYTDENGKQYIFLSFYNPTPDYEKGLYDNFLLLYCVTDEKVIMNYPKFGER